ncbi:ribonuclease E inhibitor RraB [Rhodobacteraceae bacterium M382]|nr:ribonuclease E inhibitor RraB [Rhodobacteraceae bacterium M382]
MTHDFAAQKAETVAFYTDLQAENDLPDVADVDYFLIPTSDEADWRALADQLSRDGYDCQYDDGTGSDGGPCLMATLPDQIISAGAIWIGEEVATRAALDHGFAPDGWGMES